MSVAFGVPARVVAFLRDVKPTMPGASLTCHTLAEAVGLANRLPEGLGFDGAGKGDKGDKGAAAVGRDRGVGGGRYFDCPPPPPGREVDLMGGNDMDGEDGDTDADLHHVDGRRFSVGSGSSSSRTARSSLRGSMGMVERLGGDLLLRGEREREVRALGRRPQQQRMRRFEMGPVVLITVGVALLVCFFLAGAVLGASKISGFGSA